MKRTILSLATILCATLSAQAQCSVTLSQYDENKPIGWANVDGTITGGNDENCVTVTTMSALISALSGSTAKTIYVSGELSCESKQTVKNASNKTVYGLPGSKLINDAEIPDGSTSSAASTAKGYTGILELKNCENIILRNLTFESQGAYDIDGYDNLYLNGCTRMWVDHCDFQDGVDGNFDCSNGSDYVSVTWCRFRYLKDPRSGGAGGSAAHCFSDLWGGSDSNASTDADKLNTTFANCWWDDGCIERMPRVRFSKMHILNCVYSSSVSKYCIGTGYRSNVYVEACYFDDQDTPWKNYATSSGYTDYNIQLVDNYGASDATSSSGDYTQFIPSEYYTYTANKAAEAGVYVIDETYGAGATLHLEENDPLTTNNVTALVNIPANEAEVVSIEYYNLNGIKMSAPQRGINIVRITYSDGSKKTTRLISK